MSLLHHLSRTLLDAVYPPACLLCELPLDERPRTAMLCETCRAALIHDPLSACPRCASSVGLGVDVSAGCPRCRDHTFKFASVLRLGPYDHKLRDAVLMMKSLRGETLAESLGVLWFEHQQERFRVLKPQAIVPIPLHFRRRWQRGYNQAEALADQIAAGLGVPCRPVWLRRIRHTPMQTASSASARRENVKGAFAAFRPAAVSNLRILLVDDVLTTGATVDAATDALLKAGAAQVDAAILAHR